MAAAVIEVTQVTLPTMVIIDGKTGRVAGPMQDLTPRTYDTSADLRQALFPQLPLRRASQTKPLR